jgi:hypothetical protein
LNLYKNINQIHISHTCKTLQKPSPNPKHTRNQLPKWTQIPSSITPPNHPIQPKPSPTNQKTNRVPNINISDYDYITHRTQTLPPSPQFPISQTALALATTVTITIPPAPPRTWTIHETQFDAYGNAKRGLDRDHPAPTETHTLEEMLPFPLPPGNFLYREAEVRPNLHHDHEKSGDQKRRVSEEVKKRLKEAWGT